MTAEVNKHTRSPENKDHLSNVNAEDFDNSLQSEKLKDLNEVVIGADHMADIIRDKENENFDFTGKFYIEDDKTEQQEIYIAEKLESANSKFDFYIARRNQKSKVFKPETILVAKRKSGEEGGDYVAVYKGLDAGEYGKLDEGRFLETGHEEVLWNTKESEVPGGGEIVISKGEEIGSGGMGIAQEILYRKTGKFKPDGVGVLKTLKEGATDRRDREYKIMSILKGFLDIEQGQGAEFIAKPVLFLDKDGVDYVVELVTVGKEGTAPGRRPMSLEELLYLEKEEGKNKLDFGQRLLILKQLFSALDYLAKRGLMHNDVKGDNILLTNQKIKLADFGLAIFNRNKMGKDLVSKDVFNNLPDIFTVINSSNTVYGTPYFMHGDRARGISPERQDPAYDVYSACVQATELLTGYDDFSPNAVVDLQNAMFNRHHFDDEFDELFVINNRRHDNDQPIMTEEERNKFREKLQELVTLLKKGVSIDKDIIPKAEEFIKVFNNMDLPEKLNLDEIL